MLIDVHVHSRFSFDSDEKIENYLVKARQQSVPVLGFSEHYDYDAFLDSADIGLTDIPEYLSFIKATKSKNYLPEILCGIEFGYSKAAEQKYKELSDSYDFDYIINSVHTLPERGDSYYPNFFVGKTTKEAYSDYFKAVLQSVKASFDYQIIGHIGYVSRYCKAVDRKIKYCDYAEIIDEILKEIIDRDKCLEINTSSGVSGSDFLPDKDIIERYIQLGGKKLSFGSDAHKAPDYQRKSDLLLNYLKSIGVDEMFYYKARKAIAYRI